MDGKLKKTGNDYKLYAQDDSCIAVSWYSPYQRLSLKNCEAIENGYDLDDLADWYGIETEIKSGRKVNDEDFISGFETALQILGDKKFSEEDVIYMIERSNKMNFTAKHLISNHKKTEWDVEVEMDICGDKVYAVPEPALDEDGCLILKRKI